MTIYPTLLGEQFKKLHPKLQQRYALPINKPFCAYGVMHTIKTGTKLLRPFYYLASKSRFLFLKVASTFRLKLRIVIT